MKVVINHVMTCCD